jgi:hypothetical protein
MEVLNAEAPRMRWCLSLLIVAVSLAVSAQSERPEDFIKPAIAAAGGAELLAKYPAGRVVGKGTMFFAGAETPFTCEQSFQIPGKLRTLVRCEIKGLKWEFMQVSNGEKAVQAINGKSTPVTEVGLKELQLASLLNEVAQLTPLVSDKKFTLKLDKAPKATEPVGVLVQVRGFPDLHVGFDRKTGHLVRITHKAADAELGKEVDSEMLFSEFKTVSGLTRPMRCVATRDGKKVLDLTTERFTPLEKIDPKVFTIDE